MGDDGKISFLKRVWSEALPFVARSPEMKIDWLVGVIRKGTLDCREISPYVSLLLADYQEVRQYSLEEDEEAVRYLRLFENIERTVLRRLIDCTDIYDIPLLLQFVKNIGIEEAVLILVKEPPPYEEKPDVLVDKLFQSVYEKTSEELLNEAAQKVSANGAAPLSFVKSFKRFQEIREDEKVLSSLFPQARGQIRIE